MKSDGRILSFEITQSVTGISVSDFLRKKAGFTRRQISRMKFRENGIRVNGHQVRTSYRLRTGDILCVKLSDVSNAPFSEHHSSWFPPSPELPPLEILYEDGSLLIVNKPAGVVCHPGNGHFSDTLMNQAAFYLSGVQLPFGGTPVHADLQQMPSGEAPVHSDLQQMPSVKIPVHTNPQQIPSGGAPVHADLHLIGRLDRDTSGIVVFAKSREAAQRLWKQRQDGIFTKTYLAGVEGIFPDNTSEKQIHTISAPIGRKPGCLNEMEIRPDGKPAQTCFRVLREEKDRALLEVRIRQGRTHQIRVHMASIGHPVRNDPVYGCRTRRTRPDEEMQLSAYKAELQNPFSEERIRISVSPAFL